MRILICVLALAIGGCKKETKVTEPVKDKPAPTDPGPKTDTPALSPDVPDTRKVDQSDPAKVVEVVFAAAASGKADGLASLCDPAGGGDGDVKDICGAKVGDPKWEEFVTYFAKGKVSGPAKIDGESAAVEILFGPKGDKKETMNLKKLDGKWYLDGF